jgi:hypothetical protein
MPTWTRRVFRRGPARSDVFGDRATDDRADRTVFTAGTFLQRGCDVVGHYG